jgi:hypothetical protein
MVCVITIVKSKEIVINNLKYYKKVDFCLFFYNYNLLTSLLITPKNGFSKQK